ncbi:MAG: HAD family hydrolase [SAR324 cluster bacterium]|nr:HAD family hydrolase [SAR324 cluster bacterium]
MKYQYLIFDFDGVILQSNSARFAGFEQLMQDYPEEQVHQWMKYIHTSGGISRYSKIRYFFEEVRKESVSEKTVYMLAQKFSDISRQNVIDSPFVEGAKEFLEQHASNYECSIISGSDQTELRKICQTIGIASYFTEILGSPVEKTENMAQFLTRNKQSKKRSLYIGDSTNDLEAAATNQIDFLGCQSGLVDWEQYGVPYISNLFELSKKINLL